MPYIHYEPFSLFGATTKYSLVYVFCVWKSTSCFQRFGKQRTDGGAAVKIIQLPACQTLPVP